MPNSESTGPILIRFSKYLHTLRHLRPWQVLGRLLAPLSRRASRIGLPDPTVVPNGGIESRTSFPHHDPWNRRSEVVEGRFTFLGETRELGRPVEWGAPGASLLWRFNLHYFQFLHLLERSERQALCREWIEGNPPGAGVGWHPYPTSRRIVSWCRSDVQDSECRRSLYRQVAYLSRNLETHVYGNHLIENARALVVGGAYFRDDPRGERWLRRGLSILREERAEQILEDGCHFERSPMYHALVLECYLDALNVLSPRHPARQWLTTTARTLGEALQVMRHPDGRLALFNDSTLEIAPHPKDLLEYAGSLIDDGMDPPSHLPAAGYYSVGNEDAWLVLDGGRPGPNYLMAHAHADLFSYELSVRDRRFVVDSGVYQYEAGTMRDYVRSTRAHNTVEIDGADQIECWDSFRVARRAHPERCSWRSDPGRASFEGHYRGYRSVHGIAAEHHRSVEFSAEGRYVQVCDRITGDGSHRVVSRIHLHPEVSIETVGDSVRLQREEISCELHVGGDSFQLEHGWYCPEFGRRRRNRVIAIGGRQVLPTELTYRITF